MELKCKKCGSCCRMAGRAVELFPAYKEILKPDKNGVCQHLTENNLCAIYKDRPLLCNVGELAKLKFPLPGTRLDKYYILQGKACRQLRQLFGSKKDD